MVSTMNSVTVMNEHDWHVDAIEKQLTHVNSGSVRGIYNHAQNLDKLVK